MNKHLLLIKNFCIIIIQSFRDGTVDFFKDRVRATLRFCELHKTTSFGQHFLGGVIFAVTWTFWIVAIALSLLATVAIIIATWPWVFIIMVLFIISGIITAFIKWRQTNGTK